MNCEQMTLLMSSWLDGEVTGQEEKQMWEHLEHCPECRTLFEQLQTLHTSFSDLEEIPAPEGFAQGVMARVKAEAESTSKVVPLFKRPQVRAMAGLAACVALFIGFTSVFPMAGSKEEPAAAPAALADMAAAESACDAPAEYQLETPEMPASESYLTGKSAREPSEAPAAPMEPAAGEPEAPADPQMDAAGVREGEVCLTLTELPEGMEKLGELYWEERLEDGALCARLTDAQAELLLEMVRDQGLVLEKTAPVLGGPSVWVLVWLQETE